MRLYIENFNAESVFVLYEGDSIARGANLLAYLETLRRNSGDIPTFGLGLDLEELGSHLDSAGHVWYGDEEHLYIKMAGANDACNNSDFFDAIASEASQLMRTEFMCPSFELSPVSETHNLVLNRYNVMLSLQNDCNRVIILSMAEGLANCVMHRIVKEVITERERAMLVKATVAELANMIVGLSLKHEGQEGGVQMSVPMFFESQCLLEIEANVGVKYVSCKSCKDAFKIYGINF